MGVSNQAGQGIVQGITQGIIQGRVLQGQKPSGDAKSGDLQEAHRTIQQFRRQLHQQRYAPNPSMLLLGRQVVSLQDDLQEAHQAIEQLRMHPHPLCPGHEQLQPETTPNKRNETMYQVRISQVVEDAIRCAEDILDASVDVLESEPGCPQRTCMDDVLNAAVVVPEGATEYVSDGSSAPESDDHRPFGCVSYRHAQQSPFAFWHGAQNHNQSDAPQLLPVHSMRWDARAPRRQGRGLHV